MGVSENGQNICFWSLDDGLNWFLVSKNIGLEFNYALVAIIWVFSNFPQKFPRSKKGAVTLSWFKGGGGGGGGAMGIFLWNLISR